jgi:holo-[acyl-carrier protein] synthase
VRRDGPDRLVARPYALRRVTLRIGVDLTSVPDVDAAVAAHGARYLERVYTPREIADCTTGGVVAAERLAARFAAKEAVIKILRPDDEPAPWRSIEVVRNPGGWIEVALTGWALRLAQSAGVSDVAVSITHEGVFAAAVVVAQVTDANEERRETWTTRSER